MRPRRSTHPYNRTFTDADEVPILVLFIYVGPSTYPMLDNKVIENPSRLIYVSNKLLRLIDEVYWNVPNTILQ